MPRCHMGLLLYSIQHGTPNVSAAFLALDITRSSGKKSTEIVGWRTVVLLKLERYVYCFVDRASS
jgi:hypothetical protein